jgi:16S rRNA (guanine527-N7)-methyltransferase
MREIFARAGLTLGDADLAFYERLREEVVRGNERMNLTRLIEPGDFLVKHVLDSILPFAVVPALRSLPERLHATDLGSGAGFPGLPLARFRPGWTITLLERTRKKAVFLEETIRALAMTNVRVLACDAREATALRGACGVVTARAVGRIADVTRAALGLLAPHGILVHYKANLSGEEIEEGKAAAKKARLVQEDPFVYDLPPDAKRAVVLTVNPPRRRKRA